MLHAGVEENESVAFGLEGEVLILHRAAVETHEMVFLAKNRSELVHNATVHATVVVLGALSDSCELELVDAVAVEHVVHGESEAALECGGRAEPRAEGDVSGENGIEAFDAATALDDLAADAEDVARPALGGSVLLAETELRVLVNVD